ncbi:hypothetical protein AURDEDRAFT_177065 [Auricularia subglabra TFB-10046 SS5]|uniref:Uncharacterized protein n=1 Tax=Auricularia subglabra (strain TFB-10046 / SS5) TaxID=717982 RepID=J0CU57_AURST|nr:hypothetical protein AURDEDRAFT_177065 [Auricularia subglabra TFB-10046 SS5]
MSPNCGLRACAAMPTRPTRRVCSHHPVAFEPAAADAVRLVVFVVAVYNALFGGVEARGRLEALDRQQDPERLPKLGVELPKQDEPTSVRVRKIADTDLAELTYDEHV